MLIEELRSFKEKVSQNAESEIFLASFGEEDCSYTEVKWSRGIGFSFIPYELEMSGVKPRRFLNKEPDTKDNVNQYCYVNGALKKICGYDGDGQQYEVEWFLYDGNITYSLKSNEYGERVWLKAVEYLKDNVSKACRVDFDSYFWTFGYEWAGSFLVKILTYSSNSLPGVVIYPVYKKDEVVELYFIRDDEKVAVYRK